MWCLSHEGTEDLDEVSDIMETALFRDLIDMGVGVLQEARRLLHAIGIDIIEWRLAGHASEEADEVLLVQAGELRQVPDIDFLLVVRTDVLDGLLDGEHLFLRLALLLLMDESVRIEQCDEAQEIRRDHQLIGDRRQRVGPDTAFFLLGLRSVITETTHHFIKDTQDLQETEIRYGDEIGKCPLCGKPVIRGRYGYGCTGYKDGCKFKISGFICKRTISKTNAKMLLESGKSSKIKGFISKAGKPFEGYLVMDAEGNIKFDFSN